MRSPESFDQSPFTGLTRVQRQNFVIITCKAAIAVGVFCGLLYGFLYLSRPGWQLAVSAGQAVPTTILSLLAMYFARRGKPEVGTYILVPYLLAVTALISVILGVLPAIAPVYITFIVVAGIVFGPVGGYAIAGIASLLWLGAFFGVGLGLPPNTPLSKPVAQLILVVLTEASFILTAFLSQAATSQLWRALDDAAYDLVEANRKLAEASQQKSRFLARMSHDLRTPLTAVLLSTDLTLRELYGPLTPKQKANLQRVVESARRLQTLIDDILDISKIEAGQLRLVETNFSVQRLADSVRTTLEPKAQEKGLKFEVVVAPDLPPQLVGDETRLAQILVNLTDNAIKFTEQGEVGVWLERAGEAVWRIKVRDTGRGIHESDVNLIFEEFRKAENSGPGSSTGAGLGLAITQHLVRLMHGDLHVTTELGKGSTFEVTLPLRSAQ